MALIIGVYPAGTMSSNSCSSEEAVSPELCPNVRGHIGEGEVVGDVNSDSESRCRSRSPRERQERESKTLRPKRSDPGTPVVESEPNATKDEQSEIRIPETECFPNTPSIEEHKAHSITHYPFKAWCSSQSATRERQFGASTLRSRFE